ncbi:MAG: YicC family protein [Lachnospiraceae bacterium]|nr:YicC family protein [Lachnospiraceae bacterium]MBR0153907.1 YicC family protein [Lachnospiraceae bacterium]
MLKSMTGFGRYESVSEARKITVEIKAVNHRYLDLSVKMSKKLGYFEAGIRALLKNYIQRGKVDVFITYEDYSENKVTVKYNRDVAEEYVEVFRKMQEDFGLENDLTTGVLSRCADVITLEEQTADDEELWKDLSGCISKAAERFVQTRIDEGENLKRDLFEKLDLVLSYVDFIEERSPLVVDEYRERLTQKVQELLGDTKVDPGVLATEITIFADKICVDEETVRLRSHVANMKETLSSGESIGRKLDFIAQEMNREANTTLSKSSDLAITNKAIDLKTEIEKIREQIQNIE